MLFLTPQVQDTRWGKRGGVAKANFGIVSLRSPSPVCQLCVTGNFNPLGRFGRLPGTTGLKVPGEGFPGL